ncbi:MAG TPA: hypothetical protein VNT52_11475 [Acidimicrobiales bacterium]|jgi:hypothetical protein|nr:hypothetical protein [Acidimicrobiales bacterium]
MRRAVAVTVLLVAVGLSWLGPASACSVTEPLPTEAEYVAMADVVFEGVAVARLDPSAGAPVSGTGDFLVWTFSVDRPVKGSVGVQQAVESARSGASCGFTFTLGTRYRVYAYYDGAVLRTGFPSGTREASLVTTTVARVVNTTPPPRQASPPRRIALTG